jgi:glycosyltransferase involved in cell wall biosynthesis
MKKILIHSIVFSPDGVSTAYLYNDIALKFKDNGYKVSVLTTTPHYNIVKDELNKQPLFPKLFGLYYTSNYNGIIVKHIPQKKFKSTTLRIIGFLYWHMMSFILGLFEKKVDIILSPSPPLTIGLINIILGKIKKAKLIYNVQEIYPDILIYEGGLKSKLAISILKTIERLVYNKSDAVTTIDSVFYKTIQNRFIDTTKLHIIPNFVDTSIYKPILKNQIKIDYQLFSKSNSLKLMYAGNIGIAQDWETLINTAKQLKNDNIEFYIVGEGVMKEYLVTEVEKNGLNNIHIIPYQRRELMPDLIAYSDLQFIFITSQTENQGFPSKIYTIMACAKPMIVCSGKDTPIINFLQDKKCAYLIDEKIAEKKINQIVNILRLASKEELQKMGERGFKEIAMNYSKDVITNKYLELVSKL